MIVGVGDVGVVAGVVGAMAGTAIKLRDEHAVPIVKVVEGYGEYLRGARMDSRAPSPSACIQRRPVEDLGSRCWRELLL